MFAAHATREGCYLLGMLEGLSERLSCVVELLQPNALLVDVGTDHGLIPIAAVRANISERAIAADLRELPLTIARQNVSRAGLTDRVTLHRADGLAGLADRGIDAMSMAGVSGALIVRVLEASPEVVSGFTQLVLQSNQGAELVRAWALTHGFHLRDERMVEERGQFFPLCAFSRETGPDPAYAACDLEQSTACLVGPLLLQRRDAVTLRWSLWQQARLGRLVAEGVVTLAPELAMWNRICSRLA